MKHAGLLLVLLSFASGILAQDYARLTAVQTTATVSKKPINSIALHWPDDMAASKWTVYKQNDSGRFVFKKTINAPDTSYTDLDVKTGERYTYLIYKEDVNHVLGFGIITAGIESKAPFSHGGCLLVVEDSVNMQLNAEIKRLQNDIEHEGWQTQLLVVSSKKTVSEIKAEIVKAYGASDSSLAAVLLIGKIAVPYSGNMAPD
ncbi:hypothetical protein GC194_11255, partial [bacterium]|nr:hypothetical protein [bacterium]